MSQVPLCVHATWPARLAPAVLAVAIQTLVDNPWQGLVEMAADTSEQGQLDWRHYDRPGALDIIDAQRRTLFLRAGTQEHAVEAQVWSESHDSSLLLYVPSLSDGRLREQLARQVGALPDGAYGTIFSIATRPLFPSRSLPVHLASAPWLVYLPPAAARGFDITRLQDLRSGDRQVLPDGTLWLQLYADPLKVSPVELQEAVAALESAWKAVP